MPKEISLSEVLTTLSQNEDKEVLNRLIEKMVKSYPEKAAKVAKELKLKEDFDDNNVTVTTARDLTEKQKNSLEKTIQSRYTYALNYFYIIDESLLGGIVIKKGELVIENTLKSRVHKIIDQIKLTDLNRGKNGR